MQGAQTCRICCQQCYKNKKRPFVNKHCWSNLRARGKVVTNLPWRQLSRRNQAALPPDITSRPHMQSEDHTSDNKTTHFLQSTSELCARMMGRRLVHVTVMWLPTASTSCLDNRAQRLYRRGPRRRPYQHTLAPDSDTTQSLTPGARATHSLPLTSARHPAGLVHSTLARSGQQTAESAAGPREYGRRRGSPELESFSVAAEAWQASGCGSLLTPAQWTSHKCDVRAQGPGKQLGARGRRL